MFTLSCNCSDVKINWGTKGTEVARSKVPLAVLTGLLVSNYIESLSFYCNGKKDIIAILKMNAAMLK